MSSAQFNDDVELVLLADQDLPSDDRLDQGVMLSPGPIENEKANQTRSSPRRSSTGKGRW